MVSYSVDGGKLNKQNKRGFLKEEIVTKDPATGESKKEYKYHKVNYTEFRQANQVSISFQYQLTSTESAAILITDAMDINSTDEIYYASFEGNASMLVPGYWEEIGKDSPKDKVSTSSSEISELQNMLKARRNLKSTENLKSEVLDKIAERVSKKINSYNPEE